MRTVSDQDREKIARLWIGGTGVVALAKRFGFSYGTVWKIARKAKVKRMTGEKNRNSKVCW